MSLADISTARRLYRHHGLACGDRGHDREDADDELRPVGIMLMGMGCETGIASIRLLEEENGWEEETDDTDRRRDTCVLGVRAALVASRR